MKKILKVINIARTWMSGRLISFSIRYICPAVHRVELIQIVHLGLSDVLAQLRSRTMIQSKRGNK